MGTEGVWKRGSFLGVSVSQANPELRNWRVESVPRKPRRLSSISVVGATQQHLVLLPGLTNSCGKRFKGGSDSLTKRWTPNQKRSQGYALFMLSPCWVFCIPAFRRCPPALLWAGNSRCCPFSLGTPKDRRVVPSETAPEVNPSEGTEGVDAFSVWWANPAL